MVHYNNAFGVEREVELDDVKDDKVWKMYQAHPS